MCSPVGIRVVLSIYAVRLWSIVKADFKAAFLQTVEAKGDVYVRPPREIHDHRHYWRLLAATYGLVNSNVKSQSQADGFILDIVLSHLSLIPQLF